MCSRYLLLEQHYRDLLARLGIAVPDEFHSRYNIAPNTRIPIVRTGADDRRPGAARARWGFVPAWSRSANGAPLLNARAETVGEKPTFRAAFRARRCIVPASGFYEWEKAGRARRPWLFQRRDRQPFGFAGLWETWRGPDGTVLDSCAIVTTGPNDLMRPIHDRMPVMLDPAACETWLEPAEPAALHALLQPPDAATFTATAVSPHVSNVRHEGPECIAPAPPETGDPQLSLGW